MHLSKFVRTLLAVSSFSLVSVIGATAADNHQAPVQVTFTRPESACNIVVDGPPNGQTAFDFGTWTWNGTDSYTLTSGTGSVSIGYTAEQYTDATNNQECAYTVRLRGSNMYGPNNHALDASNFKWDNVRFFNGATSLNASKSSGVFKIDPTSLKGIYAGSYTGTLDFTVQNGG